MTGLDGRTALVTGGTRGIGAAIAARLAALGARVAVIHRSDPEDGHAGAALTARCDVGEPGSVDDAFARVETELGGVDVLVNNAGIHRGGRVDRLALEDWDAVVRTNLTGSFLCTRRAVPHMAAQRWGRIINVSSVIGLNGYPGDAAYAATKAGQLGLTRALALELARDGITVNAVAPGFVETELTRGLGSEALQRIERTIPVRRQAQPDEIADAVAYLACSSYTTGMTMVVDGGWTLS